MAIETKLILLAASLLSNFMGEIHNNPVLLENIHNIRGNAELEKLVISVLEEIKVLFHTGVPEMGIPKLDPFVIDYWSTILEYPSIPLSADLFIQDVYLSGVSDFHVSDLDININGDAVFPVSYKSEVTFNNIGLYLSYGLNGTALNEVDLSSSGPLAVELTDFKLSFNLETGMYCNVIIIDKLGFGFSLEKASILITGLMNDNGLSETVSKVLSFLLPAIITDGSEDLNAAISPRIRSMVNKVLALLFFDAPGGRDTTVNSDIFIEKIINTVLALPYFKELTKH